MKAFEQTWALLKYDDTTPNPKTDVLTGLSNQMLEAALGGRILPDYIEIQEGDPHKMNLTGTMSYAEADAKGLLTPVPDTHPLFNSRNNVNILDKRTGKITRVGLYRLKAYLDSIWSEYE